MDRSTFHQARQGRLWELLAVGFCIAFGLAHLLNVFTSGDGLWYWYAVLFQRGQHLYADLHLNQQPLFILLTDYSLHLFGSSWIGFHVFPAIQIVLYSLGLMLVARFAPWKGRDRAVLILAAFGMTMTIGYYRFDDYHVTTQILQVYSIWLLLLLDRDAIPRRAMWFAVALGVLAGLSLGNRLNDGAALFGASAIALLGISVRSRVLPVLAFAGVALATSAGLVLLTGDSFHTWFFYTVIVAASIKGGSGHIWIYPFVLPFRTIWGFLKSPHSFLPAVYPVCITVCWLALPRIWRRLGGWRRLAWTVAATVLLVFTLVHYLTGVLDGNVVYTVANLGVPLAYAFFVILAFRFVKALRHREGEEHWHGRELVLLVPALQLCLAAVTAGIGVTETTPGMALTLLLLPIVTPKPLTGVARKGVILMMALIAFAAFPFKYLHPFVWHNFFTDTMFVNRDWYTHPVYGTMFVDERQLNMMDPVCKKIRKNPGTGLLAVPYPHANYFCNVTPWHGYVQTWYDTTSKATINGLMDELKRNPPTWIFYERNLATIQAHEIVYNGGQGIPHRKLDELIASRLSSSQWSVQQQKCFGGADWILIRTTPFQPGETPDLPVLMSDRLNFCERTMVPQ